MASATLTERTQDTSTPTEIKAEDRPDHGGVQGMIYAGFGSLPAGRFLLLRITEPPSAKAWLVPVVDRVTGAPAPGEKFAGGSAVQLALTSSGLSKLGAATQGQDFSRPFVEGIHTAHRSRILGDEGSNAPSAWRWGGPDSPVDLLVIVYAADEAGVAALVGALGVDAAGSGVDLVAAVPTQMLDDGREHFGFKDGISQPRFAGEEGMSDPADKTWSLVAPGEFVLGAVDQAGQRAPVPAVAASSDQQGVLTGAATKGTVEFGRDGTYLVVRQLRQDVAGFRAWALAQANGDQTQADVLAAKVVGRRADGTPLAPQQGRGEDQNDFGFAAGDPYGEQCPIGSHIRRANPRNGSGSVGDGSAGGPSPSGTLANTKRHRILRRGRAYGSALPAGVPDDGADRGLIFVALNADIERQFEFIQHHWLNSATFARPGEIDPLVGRNDAGHYTVPAADPIRSRVGALPQFVTTVGGAYFFLPSLPALRYLISLP